MCFGCSKEPSHCDGSFEYPQRMFWMRNKENNFPIHTLSGTGGLLKSFLQNRKLEHLIHTVYVINNNNESGRFTLVSSTQSLEVQT